MIRRSTEIRSATSDEMPRAVAAIVAAFLTDPIARFAWPSPHDHLVGMPLVINLKAATALGLTIPQSVLARADHVVEK